ncbi:hypothetical protein RF11_09006 [Thelohanellus kitauei]|uniref:Uncharacterized protein n=1 Tax=Thelohanellus kitauei TaxID=669202 RepID=A0A0C2MEJ2_THEKT|nr:hypothetical protein RF11_09006 [Thelohanellus kitauei]
MHDAKVTQILYHRRHSRDRDFEIDNNKGSFRHMKDGIQIRSTILPMDIEGQRERKNADHVRRQWSILDYIELKKDIDTTFDDISETEVAEITGDLIHPTNEETYIERRESSNI